MDEECEIFRSLVLFEQEHIGVFSNLHQCTFKASAWLSTHLSNYLIFLKILIEKQLQDRLQNRTLTELPNFIKFPFLM